MIEATVPAASPKKVDPRALHHRSFTLFFSAAVISNAGAWMQMVAIPALLFDLTDSSTWLGLSSLVSLVPAVLLTPYAGVLSDRVDRKHILRATLTLQTASTFALWWMYQTGHISPMAILANGFVTGIATGFQSSAWQAFIPSLVPREAMLDAVRLNSVQFTLARAIGPAVAGVLLKYFGTGLVIFINAATFLLVLGALMLITTTPNATAARDQHPLHALREGARYVWHERPVRLAVMLAFASSAFGQSLQYIGAAIANRIFGRESTDTAGLLTAVGLGAITASFFTGKIGRRIGPRRQITVGLFFYVSSPLVIGATTVYGVGLAGYFVNGLAHITMAVAFNSVLQQRTPDELRGRVMSFYLLGVLAGIPFGAFTLGALADVLPIRAVVLSVGALTFTGATTLFAKRWLFWLDAPLPLQATTTTATG